MSWLKNVLPKNSFARGVSILVGGTAGAQGLMILASPLLTRLYTPEDFGLLAVYASILSFFTVIASLRYELAIPLPEKDSEAIHIVILSLFILVFITIVSAIIVLVLGNYFSILINTPRMSKYLWLIPFGIFFIGGYQIFYYWALRTKSFGSITKTKFSQSIATLIIQLSSFKFGVVSLILGQNTGQAVGVISLARSTFKQPSFNKWQLTDIKKVAVRFKHFPIFSTWGGFLNNSSNQLPPLLFAIFFSTTTAGLYSLANRVLAMPMSLIGSAVSNVFFSEATSAYREDKLALLFESIYSKLINIIFPIILVLLIDAPKLFSIVFGENWYISGEIARWMVPWLATVFVASPFSVLFMVLERQKTEMYFQFIMLVLRIIAIWIGFYNNSMILAVQLFSIVSMFCWVGFLLWASKNIGSVSSNLVIPILKTLPPSILCTIPIILASVLELPEYVWYLSIIMTAVLIMFYYFQIFKRLSI